MIERDQHKISTLLIWAKVQNTVDAPAADKTRFNGLSIILTHDFEFQIANWEHRSNILILLQFSEMYFFSLCQVRSSKHCFMTVWLPWRDWMKEIKSPFTKWSNH